VINKIDSKPEEILITWSSKGLYFFNGSNDSKKSLVHGQGSSDNKNFVI
jgi:hypothetical protein